MNVRMPAFNRPRLVRRLAAGAAVALVLGGCSVTRPPVVKETYLLDPAPAAAVARTQPGTLRVGVVNVAAPYRTRTFVFRETDLKYESDFYTEFVVAPGANIADATARSLQRAKVFDRVLESGAPVESDWVLDGFVPTLYADMRNPVKPAAEIAISYYLSKADGGSGLPFWTRDYARRVPFTGGSQAAYAAALNTGLSEILGELARDLSAAQLPAK